MSRWIVPVSLLLLLLGAAVYYERAQSAGRTGFPAPDFVLSDLHGRPYRLSALRGKVVFLNLWATWCAPCRDEMPSMERLHRRLRGTDFVMLAVSEDDAGAAVVRSFVEQLGLTFPVLLDPTGSVPPRYGVTGYPETFIIDRSGQVIQHTIGPADWESDQVYRYFIALLGRSDPGTRAAGEPAQSGG